MIPELRFEVLGSRVLPFAMAPTLGLDLRVAAEGGAVEALDLDCQIRIEAPRRPYSGAEQACLSELFGPSDSWARSLSSMLWAHTRVRVPRFTGQARVELPVPCSFDFNAAATKYFQALGSGDVPLLLLYSGSLFYLDDQSRLQISRVPWAHESRFRLPVESWRSMMASYYPNRAWLCLDRVSVERLHDYRRRQGLPSFEAALDALMAGANAAAQT